MDIRLVLVTFPNLEDAREIGTQMVHSQLAACVSFVPGVTSIYRWEGQVREETEILAIFKTTAAALRAFESALLAAHPYDVPEFVVLSPESAHERYAEWLISSVVLKPENAAQK